MSKPFALYLLRIAKQELKEARQHEREVLASAHMDSEVEEATQVVLDAEAVVCFLEAHADGK